MSIKMTAFFQDILSCSINMELDKTGFLLQYNGEKNDIT